MKIIVSLLNCLMRASKFAYNKVLVISYRQSIESKVKFLRGENTINVLFVVPCLAKWKTESLYLAMRKHTRFNPIIGVTISPSDYPSEISNKTKELVGYLKKRNYGFTELSLIRKTERFSPNIVFYNEASTAGDFIEKYPNSLFCYVSYCFETAIEKGLLNSFYQNACWKYFVENQMLVDYARNLMDNKAVNMIPTGLPIVDDLLKPAQEFENPWKLQERQKKRIIWAPHHSIDKDGKGLHFSTFVDIAYKMLDIAEKYNEDIQIAFKPHPVLKARLYSLWGKDKTDAYYDKWANMLNTQLEDGEYMGLFKYSDALIHDSASFIVEYLYTYKPCLFLYNGSNLNLNSFSKMCLEEHYLGKKMKDVETFVTNIIYGKDIMKARREAFVNENLKPTNGKKVCDIIIDEILKQI